MSWGIVAGAAIGVVGSAISANGAKKAANTQADAATRAAELQYESQQQMREDLAPWVQSGRGANDLLGYYLGIGGRPGASTSGGGNSSLGIPYGLSEDQVRDQLRSQYTRSVSDPNAAPVWEDQGSWVSNGLQGDQWGTIYVPRWVNTAQNATKSVVDEEGLNNAVARYNQEQASINAARVAQESGQSNGYGSLLTPYRNGEEFSFTGKDLENDPGYQFGLNQGELGINRGQASRGNFLSGAAMKELARYNEDYAGTKFGEAFNRNLNTWNTNLNAYNDNRNRIYNFLSGTSSAGQNAATQVGNNNQQVANNVGNALASGANASAAGTIASSNAWQNGLNQAWNSYNSNPSSNNTAAWNSLISQGGSAYGNSGSSVSGSGGGIAGNFLSLGGI